MKLSAEMLYYKLSHLYQLQVLQASKQPGDISIPLLFEGSFPVENGLYLCDAPLPADCVVPAGSALLFVELDDATDVYANITLPEQVPCALLHGATSLLHVLYSAFEQIRLLQSWTADLQAAASGNAGLNRLLVLGQREYPREFVVFDSQYVRVGWTPGFDEIYPVRPETEDIPPEQLNLLLASPDFIDADTRRGIQVFPLNAQESRVFYWNIYRDGEYAARFMAAIEAGDDNEGERQLFGLLAQYVEECYLRQFDNQLRERMGDRQHVLMRELISQEPTVGMPHIAAMLASVGWLSEHEYRLVLIRSGDHHHLALTAPYLASRLEDIAPHSFALMSESEVIWILNLTLDRQFAGKSLIAAIEEYIGNLIVRAGLSDITYGYAELRLLYREAEIALAFGQAVHPHFWYYRFADYVNNYLMGQMTQELPAEAICHRGLARLRAHDSEHGTNFVACLASYLRCSLNVSRAAEECFVHRTTFIRYLRQIREIAGIDLSGELDLPEFNHLLMSLIMFE